MLNSFKLITNPEHIGKYKVILNGEELTGVTNVGVFVTTNEVPLVTITMLADDIEVDTKPEVVTDV